MANFDVYISYAKEDEDWVTTLVEEIEENDLSVCLKSRNFNSDLSPQENRNFLVEKCSSCVLVFSKHYCKKASEWSYFTKFIKTKDDKESSISVMLDNKGIVCVYLSHCTVPGLFSKQKMLDWTNEDLRDLFWQRLVKFLRNAQKKSQIKKALLSKMKIDVEINCSISDYPISNKELPKPEISISQDLQRSSAEETVEDTDSSDNEEEEERNKKVTDYILFNNVYPHLVSSSFNAEDEDLTKEEIENLTLKMEDVETIMLLNEKGKNENSNNNNKNNSNQSKSNKQVTAFPFESHHEQMQVLDALQTVQEIMQNRLDSCVIPKNCVDQLLLAKKKRYRRLVQRYQDCVMKAVNGKKDIEMINSLPFVVDMLNDNIDVHGFKCNCCDGLYHSKRALDLHMGYCIKEQWARLVHHTPISGIL